MNYAPACIFIFIPSSHMNINENTFWYLATFTDIFFQAIVFSYVYLFFLFIFRLNCSVPGDFPFYFNEIQGATKFVDTPDGNDKMVYATFTTPDNAIAGSAICSYRYVLKLSL